MGCTFLEGWGCHSKHGLMGSSVHGLGMREWNENKVQQRQTCKICISICLIYWTVIRVTNIKNNLHSNQHITNNIQCTVLSKNQMHKKHHKALSYWCSAENILYLVAILSAKQC